MTAEIVNFPSPSPPNPGNGARDALITIAETLPGTLGYPGAAQCWSDWLLAELWSRGFKVVPLPDNLA